jgi:hypothetical protein
VGHAFALPPAGFYPDYVEHLWWERHAQPETRVVCCRTSDGHALGDNDWRTIAKPNDARAYQIHVGAKWYDVPALAVISDLRHYGPKPDRLRLATEKILVHRNLGCR